MLTAKKKINVREPIRESNLVTRWTDIQLFLQEHSKLVSGIALGVVAVVVIGYIYISHRNSQNQEAAQALAMVQPVYDQGQFKMAIEGDRTRNILGLKDIVATYSSTNAGQMAKMYLGNCYLNLGQFDNAISVLEDASPNSDIMKSGVYAGLGTGYEGKKQYAKAAEYFEKAAKTFKDDVIAADRVVQAARNYALAGEKVKAKTLYEEVKNEYKAPRYSRDIDRYIAELGLD